MNTLNAPGSWPSETPGTILNFREVFSVMATEIPLHRFLDHAYGLPKRQGMNERESVAVDMHQLFSGTQDFWIPALDVGQEFEGIDLQHLESYLITHNADQADENIKANVVVVITDLGRDLIRQVNSVGDITEEAARQVDGWMKQLESGDSNEKVDYNNESEESTDESRSSPASMAMSEEDRRPAIEESAPLISNESEIVEGYKPIDFDKNPAGLKFHTEFKVDPTEEK